MNNLITTLSILLFFIAHPSFSESNHNSDRGRRKGHVETIGFGNIPAPRVGATPINNPNLQLIPANTGGNPSFSISMKAQDGSKSSSSCQATLIQSQNGICTGATASHCLYDKVVDAKRKGFDTEVLKKESCAPEIRHRGALWAEIDIAMADFGQVKAIAIVNQEYYSKTKSEDSAVFSFSCPKGPGNVPVLPISERTLVPGEKVNYGKVMGGESWAL